MNDNSQIQNNNPINDSAVQPVIPSGPEVPAFQVDLSGLKDRVANTQSDSSSMIIGSSPEMGPIIIDNKVEQKETEVEKNIEFGNEALQKIENANEINGALKSDTNVGLPQTQSVVPQGDDKEKTEIPPEKIENKEIPKYSGYEIKSEIWDDLEKVKREIGKGDANDGLSALLEFVSRLLRIQGERNKVK
jgi:hypothetical protein